MAFARLGGFGTFGDEIDDLIAANDFSSDSGAPVDVTALSGPAYASPSGAGANTVGQLTAQIPGSPAGGNTLLASLGTVLGGLGRGFLGGAPQVNPSASAAALAAKQKQQTTHTLLVVGGLGLLVVGGVVLARRARA